MWPGERMPAQCLDALAGGFEHLPPEELVQRGAVEALGEADGLVPRAPIR